MGSVSSHEPLKAAEVVEEVKPPPRRESLCSMKPPPRSDSLSYAKERSPSLPLRRESLGTKTAGSSAESIRSTRRFRRFSPLLPAPVDIVPQYQESIHEKMSWGGKSSLLHRRSYPGPVSPADSALFSPSSPGDIHYLSSSLDSGILSPTQTFSHLNTPTHSPDAFSFLCPFLPKPFEPDEEADRLFDSLISRDEDQ